MMQLLYDEYGNLIIIMRTKLKFPRTRKSWIYFFFLRNRIVLLGSLWSPLLPACSPLCVRVCSRVYVCTCVCVYGWEGEFICWSWGSLTVHTGFLSTWEVELERWRVHGCLQLHSKCKAKLDYMRPYQKSVWGGGVINDYLISLLILEAVQLWHQLAVTTEVGSRTTSWPWCSACLFQCILFSLWLHTWFTIMTCLAPLKLGSLHKILIVSFRLPDLQADLGVPLQRVPLFPVLTSSKVVLKDFTFIS